MSETYFFDSYAIIEILRGNPRYAPYTNAFVVTSKLNIFEVYYSLLRDFGEESAERFMKKFYGFAVEFDSDVIGRAARFRFAHKKHNISMADAIGYVLAKRLGIRFLTGDKEFEHFDNVEFVK